MRARAHRSDEQAERMHGLAQVVARRGQEPGFRGVRLFGCELLALKILDQVEVFEAQHDGLE